MSDPHIPEYYADGLPVLTGDSMSKMVVTSIFYDPETEQQTTVPRVQIVVPNHVLLSLCFNILKKMKETSTPTEGLKKHMEEIETLFKQVTFSNESENE